MFNVLKILPWWTSRLPVDCYRWSVVVFLIINIIITCACRPLLTPFVCFSGDDDEVMLNVLRCQLTYMDKL